MGVGEFGGGGSVRWRVRLEDGGINDTPEGTGKTIRGQGKDRGAHTELGNTLYVVCKGQVVQVAGGELIIKVTLANDKDQVVLKWGDDVQSVALIDARPAV